MTSLTDIANKHGTDKGTHGPSSNWPGHNYTDVYEAYLGHLRELPFNILEIGIGVPGDAWDAHIAHGRNEGGGGSLKMWREYFPSAHIFGLDINPAVHLDGDRIKTYVADQGSRKQLESFVAAAGVMFDVIIDDGSHRPDHQQVTLSALFGHLTQGGLYFVEDLHTNGRGDRSTGRFSSEAVLNTREVLRRFANSGHFPTPNALGNPAGLEAGIRSISFHAPEVRRTVKVGLSRRLPVRRIVRPITRYVDGTERLCAIRKND